MSGGHNYHIVALEDDLRMIVRGRMGEVTENIGRPLSQRDGEAIVAELRRLDEKGGTALREQLLSEVTDAIEDCFERVAQ